MRKLSTTIPLPAAVEIIIRIMDIKTPQNTYETWSNIFIEIYTKYDLRLSMYGDYVKRHYNYIYKIINKAVEDNDSRLLDLFKQYNRLDVLNDIIKD